MFLIFDLRSHAVNELVVHLRPSLNQSITSKTVIYFRKYSNYVKVLKKTCNLYRPPKLRIGSYWTPFESPLKKESLVPLVRYKFQ